MTNHLIEKLEFKVRSLRTLNMDPRHAAVEEFVLKYGTVRVGRTLPKGYRFGPLKQCFMNAYRLADRNTSLRYVEGFASRSDLPIEFRHAWCEDEHGNVIDPTWRKTTEQDLYMGVRISRKMRHTVTNGHGHYGVLWVPPWDAPNFDLLPTLAEVLTITRETGVQPA